jgi:GWxTD domain-containing protein
VRRRIAAVLVCAGLALAVTAGAAAARQSGREELAPRFEEWLKLVSYIILPAEKDVFQKLANDRDRDIFIEAFWKQRDPTPETPQNEYKDEHLRRFQYANTQLNRGTPREGWMTDMGRIYIILGEPNSRERFDATLGIHPCQVWYYYGDTARGQPTYFGLVFYERHGAGEYKLYNPVSDGPVSLLVDSRKIDPDNAEQVYQKIKELAPTLAPVAVSIIPGQIPYRFAPSPQNSILLAQILESPKKDVSPSYATHFLTYKGFVSTEYLVNYIENATVAAVLHDPAMGLDFLHFSISPQKMSVDFYEPRDEYYCNFNLNVSLRKGEALIYQYTKDYPFYFPPGRLETIQGNGIAVQDLFPVAEGTYDLTILLQNPVGKEFTVFEKSIHVPSEDAPFEMTPPILGTGVLEDVSTAQAPFKDSGLRLQADPKNTFGLGDEVALFIGLSNLPQELWSEGIIEGRIASSQAKDKPVKSFRLRLSGFPYRRTMAVPFSFEAREIVPDYYEMTITLRDAKGAVAGESLVPFIVSPAEAVPHPVTLVRNLPPENHFLYYYGLAYQYEKAGTPGKAEALFRRAQQIKPDYPEGVIEFADFLLRREKPEEALAIVEKLKDDEKHRFSYFLLKGRALMGRGEFARAIQELLEGNRIYDSDVRLLNALGFCYFRTGKKKEALQALNASLRLNQEQADVRALIARVEKELKD